MCVRVPSLALLLALAVLPAVAQDAATMAAQQAIQASEQANRDAMQASQQAAQAAQQANMNVPAATYAAPVAEPKFSIKGGEYTSPIQVRLKSSTRGTIIYYTTDGWTPTMASTRYTGPITISATTHLQAVAVAPYACRSLVASAIYNFPSGAPQFSTVSIAPAKASDGHEVVLPKGLELPLVFRAAVTSRTAEVGDPLSLELAEDVKVGDQVVLAKGTPAVGKVIQVDHSGLVGQPGTLTFQVEVLQLKDKNIDLVCERTKEGMNKIKKARNIAFIPFLGASGVLVHGEEAEIEKGTPLVAALARDTAL